MDFGRFFFKLDHYSLFSSQNKYNWLLSYFNTLFDLCTFFLSKGRLPQQLTCEKPSDRVCCKRDYYVILVAFPCAAEQKEANFMTISPTCWTLRFPWRTWCSYCQLLLHDAIFLFPCKSYCLPSQIYFSKISL